MRQGPQIATDRPRARNSRVPDQAYGRKRCWPRVRSLLQAELQPGHTMAVGGRTSVTTSSSLAIFGTIKDSERGECGSSLASVRVPPEQ